MLAAAFPFVVSKALLAEYRTVLVRPELRKLDGLTVTEVESLLTDIAQHAIVLEPVVSPSAHASGNQLLSELLAVRADLLLVTGDPLWIEHAGMRGRALSPREFMAGV